jgi:hypothetical protein
MGFTSQLKGVFNHLAPGPGRWLKRSGGNSCSNLPWRKSRNGYNFRQRAEKGWFHGSLSGMPWDMFLHVKNSNYIYIWIYIYIWLYMDIYMIIYGYIYIWLYMDIYILYVWTRPPLGLGNCWALLGGSGSARPPGFLEKMLAPNGNCN